MDFLSPVIDASRLQFGMPAGLEIIIILVIVGLLLFLGPTKLPQLARGIGKALGEFRRGRMEIERQIRQEVDAAATHSGTQQVVEISPRLVEAAKELKIDVLGRRERDLKMEIIRALDRKSENKLRKVAGFLGVTSDGLDHAQLKDRIGEALGI
ncbi:MAG: twin-arginine translocase TatA/TatE family subunit [Candidatus Thermoplasmatota archaeon]|nr:twin-arginine translocase TatA/TatE family subunit [Candidatus Thermoplasmatota archaeon]